MKRGKRSGWLAHPATKRLAVEAATAAGGPVAGALVGFGHSYWADRRMGSYGQGTLTRERRKYGKSYRRGGVNYARLIARASVNRVSYGISDYTTYGGTYGKWFLRNYHDTRALTATTGGYYLPCHLWDVSAVPNIGIGSDVPVNAQCGYRIGISSLLGTYEPRHRTLGTQLQAITTPGTSGNSQSSVRTNSMLRAVKAKMMFYCPTSLPVRVRVSLIQLKDARFHPSKNTLADTPASRDDFGEYQTDNTLLPNDGGGAELSAASFWADVNRSYAVNPVAMGVGVNASKYMKVLKSINFILNPKETSDNSATTYHMVDFYHKFNRRMNYNWENTSLDSVIQGGIPFNKSQCRCCVEPDARLYLMIQSDSKFTSGAADPPLDDSANSTSYDICLRTYHDDFM